MHSCTRSFVHSSIGLIRRHRHPRSHASQQHNRVTCLQHSAQLLAEIKQPSAFNVEHPQLVFLALDPVVQIRNLQALGRQIQHPAHAVLGRVEEIALGHFGRDGVGRRFHKQVHALLLRDLRFAFRGALERRELLRLRRRGLFRLRHGRFGQVGFLRGAPSSQPVESSADFLFLGVLFGARAERDEVAAVVVVGEAVLEAVGSVAFVAVHAGDEGCVDQGLATGVRALLLVGQDIWFGGERDVAFRALVCGGAVASPFAGFGAFVGCFGAVVEAELAVGSVC